MCNCNQSDAVEYSHRSEWCYGRQLTAEDGTSWLWLSPYYLTREETERLRDEAERNIGVRYTIYRRTTVTTLVVD